MLMVLIALAPLALGSNRPLPWAYNALLAGLALLAAAFALPAREAQQTPWRAIAIPLALMMLVSAWIVVQILPVATPVQAHPNWDDAATRLGAEMARSITTNRHLTLQGLMRLSTYVCVFLAAFIIARDRRLASALLHGFAVVAAVYALYGMVRLSLPIDRILWFEVRAGNVLTSTFINRNSAATFLGLGAIAVFGLVLLEAKRTAVATIGATRQARLRIVMEQIGGPLGLMLGLFSVIFIAVILTGSRGGVGFTLSGLAVLIILQILRGRQHKNTQITGPAKCVYLFALVAVVFVLVELSGTRLAERLISQNLEAQTRLTVYLDTLNAISDHSVLGTGYGTFEDVYPLYRSTLETTGVWDKAHNDYLELFLGLGIPAGIVFLAGIAGLLLICVRGVFLRRRDAHYAAIAVGATFLVAMHSLVDFSLQIEAVALSYALLMGIGTAQSFNSEKRRTGHGGPVTGPGRAV